MTFVDNVPLFLLLCVFHVLHVLSLFCICLNSMDFPEICESIARTGMRNEPDVCQY